MGRKTVIRKPASKKARKAPSKRASKSAAKPARKPRPKPGALAKQAVSPSWTAAEIEEAFSRFAAANPEPVGELNYVTPFTLLVAVVLSAQATDASVNKATPALFALADTPEKMVALGEERVRDLIKTIGLFRTKARNVIALSRQLIEQHAAVVPKTRAELEALPGVGRKTANVVLNTAFGEPTIAVDTHIFRIGNRTGLAPGKTPLEVEEKLEHLVPAKYLRHAHHWLILHGRYVCVARSPHCDKCLINDLCKWPAKSVQP
jgi:endonuclease III